MAGKWEGCQRIRIGTYRAIYRIVEQDDSERVDVLHVGPRGKIYK